MFSIEWCIHELQWILWNNQTCRKLQKHHLSSSIWSCTVELSSDPKCNMICTPLRIYRIYYQYDCLSQAIKTHCLCSKQPHVLRLAVPIELCNVSGCLRLHPHHTCSCYWLKSVYVSCHPQRGNGKWWDRDEKWFLMLRLRLKFSRCSIDWCTAETWIFDVSFKSNMLMFEFQGILSELCLTLLDVLSLHCEINPKK